MLERRRFRWVSSVTGPAAALEALDRSLSTYYSETATRQAYQSMIDAEASSQPATEAALRAAIVARRPRSVLEIGCGSGRFCERLSAEGYAGAYAGLEMSRETIEQNRGRFPSATWIEGSVYEPPFPANSFDVVFSYFVLEHCVYPSRALAQMWRLVAAGGCMLLVFPDFGAMGRLASQPTGLVGRRASECLRRGEVLRASVALIDSRIRLPRALRRARQNVGSFPVNLRPRCLTEPEVMTPDADAVYISWKPEISEWAATHGLAVSYPAGVDGHFRENALMEVRSSAVTQVAIRAEVSY